MFHEYRFFVYGIMTTTLVKLAVQSTPEEPIVGVLLHLVLFIIYFLVSRAFTWITQRMSTDLADNLHLEFNKNTRAICFALALACARAFFLGIDAPWFHFVLFGVPLTMFLQWLLEIPRARIAEHIDKAMV